MSAATSPVRQQTPEEQLEALLPDISRAVRSACLRYDIDEREIEDLYSEIILLRAEDNYRRLRSFRRESSRRTWITVIVRHYVSNHVKRNKDWMDLDEAPADLFVCNPSQEKKVISADLEAALRRAVGRLTPRERQLFELLCRDDLTPADISVQMGTKIDSVHRRKHALIRKLQAMLNSSVPCAHAGREKKDFEK